MKLHVPAEPLHDHSELSDRSAKTVKPAAMRTFISLSLVVILINMPLVSAKCWYFGTQRYCHGQISVSPSINIHFFE